MSVRPKKASAKAKKSGDALTAAYRGPAGMPADVCERCAAPINPSDWPLVCCERCGKLICPECCSVNNECVGYCDA